MKASLNGLACRIDKQLAYNAEVDLVGIGGYSAIMLPLPISMPEWSSSTRKPL